MRRAPCGTLRDLLPEDALRGDLPLPELSEPEVIRHYTHLSQNNYSIDSGFYPLGSCTMKYNPKINEEAARLPGLARVHPLQPSQTVQGTLEVLYEMQGILAEIAGMDAVTLQPAAGAHGELLGLMLIKAHHDDHGQGHRDVILVPDSAHGTNPASAARCGYKTAPVQSDARGRVDLTHLKAQISDLSDRVAGLMLTNPNTLGLFEDDIAEVCALVHQHGGLVYCDGANMNALVGRARPATWASMSCTSTCTRRFPRPTEAAGRVPARWPSSSVWSRTCPCRWCPRRGKAFNSTMTVRSPSAESTAGMARSCASSGPTSTFCTTGASGWRRWRRTPY